MSAKGFSVSARTFCLLSSSRLGLEMSVGVQKERCCLRHIVGDVLGLRSYPGNLLRWFGESSYVLREEEHGN